jgi:hypothetical protein
MQQQGASLTGPYGIHVNGADRLSGVYASIGPMYQMPGAAPAPGGTDERLFPLSSSATTRWSRASSFR